MQRFLAGAVGGTRKAGLARRLNGGARNAATAAAHFGYGGSIGALYPYASALLPGPPLVKGALFPIAAADR